MADLLDFGAELHARHDYPATAAAFARALGIHLIPGDEDTANAGPPALITYNAAFGLHRRRFSLWHELAHVVMAWHGIEADYEEWLGEELAQVPLENIANLLAGLFMVPRPVMKEATEKYGLTPAAILHMQHVTGMSEAVCLRRFTYDDLSASRAAAIFYGPYVADLATFRYKLPFGRYSRVPEPALVTPDAALQRVRGTRVIGVWEG